MNKALIILLISLSSLSLKAQIIDNKVDINLGYCIGKFGGDDLINEDGFISPALYSNYESTYNIRFKCIFIKMNYLNFGASIDYCKASDWNMDLYSYYKDSESAMYSFSPLFQVHPKVVDYGFLNRVGFYLEVAPTIGISEVTVPEQLFDVEFMNSLITIPDNESDIFYGIKGTIGVNISINQSIGIFFESGAGYYRISPGLFVDTHFTNFNAGAGIMIKLVKNKRFFY